MKPVNQPAKAVQLTDENIPLRPPRSGNGGRCRRHFGRSGRSVVDEDHLLHRNCSSSVQFSSNRTGLYDGSPRDAYIGEREASNGMSVPAEKLAQILGGSASDYESDLTITDADVPGLAVTARGRTPSAARALATDAAEALCSMFEEANAMTSGGFTFTVVPPGN